MVFVKRLTEFSVGKFGSERERGATKCERNKREFSAGKLGKQCSTLQQKN